jgi:uncharacterized protein (DUF305 family)
MKTLRFALGTALILGFAGPVCAQAQYGGHDAMKGGAVAQADMQKMMQDAAPKPDDTASTKDFKAADTAMIRNMQVPYTGDPDVDFRTHMIPHHEGAVEMARVALKHVKDPETTAMAQKIIADQMKEIVEMKVWLKAHGH